MGRLRPVFNSVILVGAAASTLWNLLLDDRAKAKVNEAVKNVVVLTNYVVYSYMDPNGQATDEFAAEHNRSWVEQQWKEAGY